MNRAHAAGVYPGERSPRRREDQMRTTRLTTIASLALAGALLAACGSSGSGGTGAGASTAASTGAAASTSGGADSSGYGGYGTSTAVTSTTPAGSGTATTGGASTGTVNLATNRLGQILVDSAGRTLYLFEADKGTRSTCSGACATAWPPLLSSGAPKAGAGVNAGDLGSTARADGGQQVTYHGHPLYHFARDTAPGQTRGQDLNGFGADWYVLGADGNKIDS
jgi:predicted lipoprotein with Yx(FWY)xxD motif